jgi:hypothetical protein
MKIRGANHAHENREVEKKGEEEDDVIIFNKERIIVASLFCGYFGREFCSMHLFTTSKLWQLESGIDDKVLTLETCE